MHTEAVCTCGGPGSRLGGWPPAAVASRTDTRPCSAGPALASSASSVSPAPPALPTAPAARDLLAATKMLLYSFLSEQSPETLVKIPSFPFGEGLGTSGQCQPVRLLLWVSGKAPVHTHPFLVHTHLSPGLKLLIVTEPVPAPGMKA